MIGIGEHVLRMDLEHWVNDALMALFFFVIGLEVRRELSIGELTERRRVVVPAVAALCGIVVPALLFLAVNPSGDAARGWGVVIGTDTAFLLGALAIVGPRCPTQLRVFLLTLTVFDDIVAVSIIGIVYSESIDFAALAVAAVALLGLALLSRRGEWRASLYVVLGVVLWVATLESGLHPSIAGMIAGLAIASRAPVRAGRRSRRLAVPRLPPVAAARGRLHGHEGHAARGLGRRAAADRAAPVDELRDRAGVRAGQRRASTCATACCATRSAPSLTWGIVLGLVVGKLLGIGLGALAALRLDLGVLPRGVRRGQMLGGAALSGIGFTVSLLIAHLAFDSRRCRTRRPSACCSPRSSPR